MAGMGTRAARLIAAGALAGALCAGGSSAAQAATDCRLVPSTAAKVERAASVERVQQTRTATGLQRTAYQEGGVYTATLCDEAGAPRKQQTVIPLRLPDGSIAHVAGETTVKAGEDLWRTTSAVYGDVGLLDGDWRAEIEQAKALVIAPGDAGLLTKAAPPQFDAAEREAAAATRRVGNVRFGTKGVETTLSQVRLLAYPADNKCSYGNYASLGGSSSAYGYQTNWSSLGAQYQADFDYQTTIGFHTWQFNLNYCGWGVRNNVGTANYGATTAASNVYDGINVVDFGDVGSMCPGSIACAPTWISGGVILERGIRLNWSYPYTIGRQAGHYDIRSVIAHESGHGFGFADIYADNDRWHTMFGYMFTDDDLTKYQAWGDYAIQQIVYG